MLTIPQDKLIFKGYVRMKMSEFLQIDPYMIKYQPLTDLQEVNGNKFNVVVLENDGYTIENYMEYEYSLPISFGIDKFNYYIGNMDYTMDGDYVDDREILIFEGKIVYDEENDFSSFTFEKDTVIELLK